jgi:hypothetical protein
MEHEVQDTAGGQQGQGAAYRVGQEVMGRGG